MTTTYYVPYKVKDMSLADWGRTEIKLLKPKCQDLWHSARSSVLVSL